MSDPPAAGNPASGITPETVPAEWLQAGWDADHAWLRSPDRERGGPWERVHEKQLRRHLAAIAPLIAAAERGRAEALIAEQDATLSRVRSLLDAAIFISGERYVRADYIREALEGDSDE